MVDYIKSFGREQSRQHKHKEQFYAPSMYKAGISVWKGRPKETTVQALAKLSVQVYKSDCVSVNDRWI